MEAWVAAGKKYWVRKLRPNKRINAAGIQGILARIYAEAEEASEEAKQQKERHREWIAARRKSMQQKIEREKLFNQMYLKEKK